MAKFEEVLAPGITIRESANDGSDFTNPTADYRRLFLGEDGLLHVKDSSGTVTDPYTSGGSVTVATGGAVLGGDVTMTTPNTGYDGPSVAVPAGSCMVWYKAVFEIVGTQTLQYTVRLWDGSTTYDESQSDMVTTSGAGFTVEVSGFVPLSAFAGATLKITAYSIRASQKMLRDVNVNGVTSHTATRIAYLKVS